jgi:post-segregation antitoxin (ccd killing protein)
MKESMARQMKRIEVKVRITEDLHSRLQEEQRFCGCSISALVTLGLARELGIRRMRRQEEANRLPLEGQLMMDKDGNA